MFRGQKITYTSSSPESEPLARGDVKDYLRIDQSVDDVLVDSLITAARIQAEKYTNTYLLTQTITMTMDYWSHGDVINLPKLPVQSVTSLTTYDTTNAATVWVEGTDYMVDAPGARIIINDGSQFPGALRKANALQIIYVAGYGDDADYVPTNITQGMMQLIAHMYENREVAADVPPIVQMLWDSSKQVFI